MKRIEQWMEAHPNLTALMMIAGLVAACAIAEMNLC